MAGKLRLGLRKLHPWEDFAECFAHYIHIVDSLETAREFGVAAQPPKHLAMAASIDFDPYQGDSAERLVTPRSHLHRNQFYTAQLRWVNPIRIHSSCPRPLSSNSNTCIALFRTPIHLTHPVDAPRAAAKKDDICKGLKEKAASSIKLANEEGLPIRPIRNSSMFLFLPEQILLLRVAFLTFCHMENLKWKMPELIKCRDHHRWSCRLVC